MAAWPAVIASTAVPGKLNHALFALQLISSAPAFVVVAAGVVVVV